MINEERLLKKFLEYVQIDSESFSEKEMAERAADDLRALGCQVWTDDAAEAIGSSGFNVCARLAASEGCAHLPPILFSAHLDTVKPGLGVKPVIKDGVIYSSGDTVLGSDDKAGLAAVVEALNAVTESSLPHPEIEVLFSLAEESGLLGAKHADLSRFNSKEAVVLDCSGDVGGIITAAPGQVIITAAVTGRSAHAGIAPEEGVSAIQAAAAGVAAMKLLRIDSETTANVGTFKAEYATNIVPEKVIIKAEARSRDAEKLKKQQEHMIKCLEDACTAYGAALEYDVRTEYVSYSFTEDEPLVQRLIAALKEIGIEHSISATGGGSDANIMNQKGIKAVVIAIGMEKVHTTSERITIKNLNNSAKLCLALMKS